MSGGLSGKRVLITRPYHQSPEMAERVRRDGGLPVIVPLIETVPPSDRETIEKRDRLLQQLYQYDWVIFTSANGVAFFLQRYRELFPNQKAEQSFRIAVVGTKTARYAEEEGFQVDVIPESYHAEGLVEALLPHIATGEKVLFPRARIARNVLPEALRERGIEVDEIIVYDTVMPANSSEKIKTLLKQNKIDIVTFTSSSAVKHFVKIIKEDETINLSDLMNNVVFACIGPVAADTARKKGLRVDVVPQEDYTVEGLIRALHAYF